MDDTPLSQEEWEDLSRGGPVVECDKPLTLINRLVATLRESRKPRLPTPNGFCTYCGSPFAVQDVWPRTCTGCDRVSYRNPIPVVATIIPVFAPDGRLGVVVIRRNLPPVGKLALPGGYLEWGEAFEVGSAREILEEGAIHVVASSITPFLVRATVTGILLIFGLAEPIRLEDVKIETFKPNHEVQELGVLWRPEPLAFPFHTEALERFFALQR